MGLLRTNYGEIPVLPVQKIETVSSIDGDSILIFVPQVEATYYIDSDTGNTAVIPAFTPRGIHRGITYTFSAPIKCELVYRG